MPRAIERGGGKTVDETRPWVSIGVTAGIAKLGLNPTMPTSTNSTQTVP